LWAPWGPGGVGSWTRPHVFLVAQEGPRPRRLLRHRRGVVPDGSPVYFSFAMHRSGACPTYAYRVRTLRAARQSQSAKKKEIRKHGKSSGARCAEDRHGCAGYRVGGVTTGLLRASACMRHECFCPDFPGQPPWHKAHRWPVSTVLQPMARGGGTHVEMLMMGRGQGIVVLPPRGHSD
jgi:hypothetical protein